MKLKIKDMLSIERYQERQCEPLSPEKSGNKIVQEKNIEDLLTTLQSILVLKQRSQEREKRAREKQNRIESILPSLLDNSLIGVKKRRSIKQQIRSMNLEDARDSVSSASETLLDELRSTVAHKKLKVMASKRNHEDPTLSGSQARTLSYLKEIVPKNSYGNRILKELYREKNDKPDPLIQQYEAQARSQLLSELASQATTEECLETLAQRLYLKELSWLRKEIGSTLETVGNVAPNISAEEQNHAVIKIVHALYEMRIRQSGDPVNPLRIKQLLAEALLLNAPLRIIIIKCLAHSYSSGKQEVVSIYNEGGNLKNKERQFLDQILEYQRILNTLEIPNEIVVAVADTDIPYQREESINGEKWETARVQIEETKRLYKQYGLSVLPLMQVIESAELIEDHDRIYREVKQRPLIYIPSIYLERRINKRYEKYNPLEGMTRARARKVVINSYAEEAALGTIWNSLWGQHCLHLVYKTTYLASAMEVYRQSKKKIENIPTIFSSGQGKLDSDGLEYDQ